MGPVPDASIVVITDPAAEVRLTRSGLRSGGRDVRRLAEAIAPATVRCLPMFGNQDRRAAAAGTVLPDVGIPVPDLSGFYRVQAPVDRLESLAAEILALDIVTAAYVEPPTVPPVLRAMIKVPLDAEPSAVSPSFVARQGYLDAAPRGIDARYAWSIPGGDGAGVNIIDVELGGWRFSHEDLNQNQGGAIGDGTGEMLDDRNHGTAVVGELSGDLNDRGIIGICPAANIRGVYARNIGSAAAIRVAADLLGTGDILVVEAHRPGPTVNFTAHPTDDTGYIAIEWWEADFQAIRYAIARGVVVVAAAGNGGVDLDADVFDDPGAGFPETWRNAFDRSVRDSGSILVGAGAPASTTFGPARSRLDFSNYGSVVDAQGWGREVVTTGYGDLQGGLDEDEWYTAGFSGTSSATPIVAGALASVQGSRSSRIFGQRLTPAQARHVLRTTGTPQTDGPVSPATERIGSQPSIGQMIPGPVLYTVTHRGYDIINGPRGGQLMWHRHLGRGDGSDQWSDGGARGLTKGWAEQKAFTSNYGVVYAIQENGDLLWRRHLGQGDGSNTWSPTVQVGHGWDFTHVFSGGAGAIYAVRKFGLDPVTGRQLGGDLLMYEHLGWSDGSPRWKGEPKLVATKWYYDRILGAEDGRFYGITRNGDMFLTTHTSRGIGGDVWEPARQVGSGWDFQHVVYGGKGIIYAIDADGDVWWYRHDGYTDATPRWSPRVLAARGWDVSSVLAGNP